VSRNAIVVLVSLVVAVWAAGAGCGDATPESTGPLVGPFSTASVACHEEGVNQDPFTVSDALALNGADHEDPADYAWNSADVVPIAFAGSAITIGGAGATASGSTLTITAGGTYSISGTLNDGQIVVNAKGALVRLVLNGMTITKSGDAAIFVSKASKAVIELAGGTVNRVTDGTTYPAGVDQNAAVFSKTNLSIHGEGVLVVTGRYADGITSKDGLVIDGGHITVNAVDDGIRGKDYLVVRAGTIDVTAGGDALKSDEDVDATLGYVLITGGSITGTSGDDGIQAQTDVLITGGTVALRAGGGSSATVTDTAVSSKGVDAGVAIVVDGGTIDVDAADDGFNSSGIVVINGGTTTVASGDDGIHGDSTLVINAGDVSVTKSYEGIENTLADMTFNGGRIHVVSTDDGINLAGNGDADPDVPTGDYTLRINAGRIVSAADGDGLDANGHIVMNGGCVIVNGPTNGDNGAIDYHGTFRMNGGLLVAAGSAEQAEAPGASSTQYSVLLTLPWNSQPGTLIHIQSQAGVGVLDFAPAKAFRSLAFSSPALANATTYNVYLGGTATGTPIDGLYEGAAFADGTLVQSITISGIVTH